MPRKYSPRKATRTAGIYAEADGSKVIDKRAEGGLRIFKRLGAVAQEAAERWLAGRLEQRHLQREPGGRPRVSFADAAARYLRESEGKLRSRHISIWHIKLLAPFIGAMELREIHDGTLEPFVKHRLEVDGVSLTTVNRSLEVARRVLNLAARKYRHPNGVTWLESAPLITIDGAAAREHAREPYPLTWDEQDLLFAEIAARAPHLHKMALFKVNTGTREKEVCRLLWAWEAQVPELSTSVFIVPRRFVKNKRDRLIVLNGVAKGILDELRRAREALPEEQRSAFVFTWKRPWKAVKHDGEADMRPGKPLDSMNNTAWQGARKAAAEKYEERFGRPAPAGFASVRVHDLKHTFGRRLRAAGVALETRQVLLGHTNGSITTHYSGAELAELIAAANKIDRSQATPAITILRTAA